MSLLRLAARANSAAISATASRLNCRTLPKSCEPLTSTINSSVSSRSSMKRLTYNSPMRAVTFQSTVRTSSPA